MLAVMFLLHVRFYSNEYQTFFFVPLMTYVEL